MKLTLVTFLGVVIGFLFYLLLDFETVTLPQLIATVRSPLLVSDVDVYTLNILTFCVTLALLISLGVFWGLRKISKLSLIVTTALQCVVAIVMVAQFLVPTVDMDIPGEGARGLEDRNPGEAASSVLHLFVESFAPNELEGFGASSASSLFLPQASGSGFQTVKTLPGHGNTIMGLISAWCGVPFPEYFYSDPMSKDFGMKDTFCIHDSVLFENHEKQYFGGYYSEFQGKSVYFEHRQIEDFDLRLWDLLEPENLTSWRDGLNDRALLRNVSSSISRLVGSGVKFYVSALTLDNHLGTPSQAHCLEGNSSFEQSLEATLCTGFLVQGFLDEISVLNAGNSPLLIVVQGDHPPPADPNSPQAEVFFWASCLRDGQFTQPVGNPPQRFDEIAEWMIVAAQACENDVTGR